MALIKKVTILFPLFLIIFLTPIRVYAVEKNPSLFSAIPIAPLIILVILITAAGIIFYFQVKRGKETPYNLPSSTYLNSSSQENTPTSSLSSINISGLNTNQNIQTVTPPLADFKERVPPINSQETSSLSPNLSSSGVASEKKTASFLSLPLVGLASILLIIFIIGAYFSFLRKKPLILEVGQRCNNSSECGTGQVCINGVCKITPSGDGPGGCCSPGLSAENGGCRDWEICDISNGACSSGLSCRDTGSGQPVQCGSVDLQCIENCSNRQGEEKCYNGKIYFCGNDCCFHKKLDSSGSEISCQASPQVTASPAPGKITCSVNGSTVTITNGTNETIRVACWQFECDKKSATYQQCLTDKCEGSNGHEVKQATLSPGQSDSCTASSGQICTIRQVDWMITGTASALDGCWAFNRNCPDPYICQTVTPQCRGLRVLINKGGSWTDISEAEKNNLPPGTIIRLALPKNIDGAVAEKASFQVLINNVNDFIEDTTTTMDINGQPYFYKEITTKLKGGISFSNYQVYGWLFINGAWR